MTDKINPAYCIETGCIVYPNEAIKGYNYKCPQCNEPAIFRKGDINRPHFAHKSKCACNYYTNEAAIHYDAKELLKDILNNRKHKIIIKRTCQIKGCENSIVYEIDILDENLHVITEHPFLFKNCNKRADIACVDSNKNIEFIIEICNKNPTSCEVRPEPWFELNALDVYNKLNDPAIIDVQEITFDCIRNTFCSENRCYGLCEKCEEIEKGCIYHNQRGAGCGKTYESIQLIQSEQFSNKSTFIYLTKMHSAVEVIYKEITDQFQRNALGNNIEIVSDEQLEKHYRLTLQRTESNGENSIIKILIGTIDSFNYAVCSNKVLRGNNAFEQLVLDIKNGHVSISPDGSISFAQTRPKLSRKCLLIVDEAQDLNDSYIGMFETVIDRTGIDVFIIGDKLQSILSETNVFTKMEKTAESSRIIKSKGANIVKRFHNDNFPKFVNDIVKFKDYGLEPIVGICDKPNSECGHEHENHIIPYTIDPEFDNIYTIEDEQIQKCIDRVISDMKEKIDKHGYLPYNFCYIFLVVNEKNKILSMLYPALESFWVDFFSNPESYTSLVLENMKKKAKYWENKLLLRELDTNIYKYVILHRSEQNRPINLKESENASRILSVHASKGTGCECVYFLGLSEMTLTCHTGGMQNLIYESLLHVGLTRQKKYLYVGYDGSSHDDICKRMYKYDSTDNKMEPYIANISSRIKLQTICKECTNDSLRENNGESFYKQCDNIIDFSDKHIEEYLPDKSNPRNNIDWGHHIIRWCVLYANINKYLYENVDPSQQHFYAKYKQIIDDKNTKFVYCLYKEYKQVIRELNNSIDYNSKHIDKIKEGKLTKKTLIIPILIFSPTYEKNSFSKYHKFIEKTINSLIYKLKHKDFNFCPIETIMYVYIMEMMQHPYTTRFSIVDMYHIIYDYDDCLTDPINHSEEYKCKCCEYIKPKSHNIVSSNEHVKNSIVNHYEAIKRIKYIMNHYNDELKKMASNKKIIYKIDKNIGKFSEFSLYTRVNFLGKTEDNKFFIHFYLAPQLSSLNIYEILTEVLFTQYIIKYYYSKLDNEKYNSDSDIDIDNQIIVKCCIITLDSENPIIVDMNDIIESKKENIKLLLKDLIETQYKNNNTHQRIFNYMEYCRTHNIIGGSYLFQIQKQFNEDKKNLFFDKKSVIRCDFPDYIIDWIKNTDMKITDERNKNKRHEYKENLKDESWVINELNNKLDYELNSFLDINLNDDDDDW